MSENIFITGTDTGVGKTYSSAILCKKINADYWKPIQCGVPSDTKTISSLGINTHPESYIIPEPKSPYPASKNLRITKILEDFESIKRKTQKSIVIEGAGGLMVPISKSNTFFDLICSLKSQVIIVIPDKIGCLNHTFLTIEKLRQSKAVIIGGILNSTSSETQFLENKTIIETVIKLPIIMEIRKQPKINNY